jgi:citrate lyase beta subunit
MQEVRSPLGAAAELPAEPDVDSMRHFDFIGDAALVKLFHRRPEVFRRDAERDFLSVALGGTLYSPATRPNLVQDLIRGRRHGVMSSVLCLEASIPDHAVEAAQANAVDTLRTLAMTNEATPLIFVRVRNGGQITQIAAELGSQADQLSGFVLPQFTAGNGPQLLQAVIDASDEIGRRLWAMPVIESQEVIFHESRSATLQDIHTTLAAARQHVLAVRIGATDLSSAYGLRRPRELTIYDVQLVAQAIADIVNVLGRLDGGGYTVTGPVWEYFDAAERIFKPQLRETPFGDDEERALRAAIIASDLDGLIREVVLDRANGLTGKTLIHPSHVATVHALSVVSHEEYVDAIDILGAADAGGGVACSKSRNKMNEATPHRAWAERTLLRARVFGVAHEGTSFVDLLGASVPV